MLDSCPTPSEEKRVRIRYTNYRGETAVRTIVPERIFFGSNEWHPKAQWLIEAYDLERKARRTFAAADIHEWRAED